MEIEAIRQCDAIIGGQRKALFPGQRYDLPDAAAGDLIQAGHIKRVGAVETTTGVAARPRGRGRKA